jgi:type II secretory pathway component PulM
MPGAAGGGRHASQDRPGKNYRGSKKRVDRIKWRDNTPRGFWILIVLTLFLLFAGISWLVTHPPDDHYSQTDRAIRR